MRIPTTHAPSYVIGGWAQAVPAVANTKPAANASTHSTIVLRCKAVFMPL